MNYCIQIYTNIMSLNDKNFFIFVRTENFEVCSVDIILQNPMHGMSINTSALSCDIITFCFFPTASFTEDPFEDEVHMCEQTERRDKGCLVVKLHG